MAIAHQRDGLLLQGRYRLRAEIGAGASARVYLADDTRLDRPVAVKLLHAELAHDESVRSRFRAEARAVATLNHPNIVHVYDWGEGEGELHLVLEYLSGGSLRELLRREGRISVAQAAVIGHSVALALGFAHRRGFVHRDVKPGNLLFDESGTVHLADFGLASALAGSPGDALTSRMGTARYASPEQALGSALDGRSDVYSLAIVLFESVTGRVPFAGETAEETLHARIGGSLPDAPELGVLGPCLQEATRFPASRRLDASEFADALRRAAAATPNSQPLRVRSSASSEKSAGADEAAEAAFGAEPSTQSLTMAAPPAHRPAGPGGASHGVRRRSRRARRAVAIVGLLALAAAALLATDRFAVFDHRVPKVTGDQLALAQRAIARADLRAAVSRHEYSTSVAAGSVVSQSPRPGTRERSGVKVAVVVSSGPRPVQVPPLAGLTKSEAIAALDRSHLSPVISTAFNETVPAGRVVGRASSSGKAPYGSKVPVLISLGPHPRTIPDFPTTTFAVARHELVGLRLVPSRRNEYSNAIAQGLVIATDPPEGATGVKVGSKVVVLVSRGPQLIPIPIVANESIADAVASLRQVGLDVNEQIGPPFATKAVSTDPAPGTRVRIGTAVTLYVA